MKAEIRNNQKQCRRCLEWKDLCKFGRFIEKRRIEPREYVNSRCKKCASESTKEWAVLNKNMTKERLTKKRDNLLDKIHAAYGGKCACCGETNRMFITIDHINNDGFKLRRRNGGEGQGPFSITFYESIIDLGYPRDLQLLCWNCNCGRHRNKGICPHQV